MSGTMDPTATDVDQQELAQQLLAQAWEQGTDRVGPDGLLNRLTKKRSVVIELDETDALDEGLTPGGELVSEELIVQVVPQATDEFTCYSGFLVRHRSQIARESHSHSYCLECEGLTLDFSFDEIFQRSSGNRQSQK
ncbi:hypothetical protein QFZ33_002355 [Arthrobacter globiformis]|nr:hypothetical protein [Arthrobacter globiformis]